MLLSIHPKRGPPPRSSRYFSINWPRGRRGKKEIGHVERAADYVVTAQLFRRESWKPVYVYFHDASQATSLSKGIRKQESIPSAEIFPMHALHGHASKSKGKKLVRKTSLARRRARRKRIKKGTSKRVDRCVVIGRGPHD